MMVTQIMSRYVLTIDYKYEYLLTGMSTCLLYFTKKRPKSEYNRTKGIHLVMTHILPAGEVPCPNLTKKYRSQMLTKNAHSHFINSL